MIAPGGVERPFGHLNRAHDSIRFRIIRVELQRTMRHPFTFVYVEVWQSRHCTNLHRIRASEIRIRLDGPIEPFHCFEQILIRHAAESVKFQTAQVAFVGRH